MNPAQTLAPVRSTPAALPVIGKAGLIAGTLDILAACISFMIKTGKNPVRVLEYVASGAFGKPALGGGALYGVAGLLFHFLIAFIWATVFYYAWPVFRLLKNRLVMGVIYGILVWLVMNLVVVPLCNAPKGPFSWSGAIQGCLILIVCIGIPIAWIVGKNRASPNPSGGGE
jgi:hypothetical protein